MTPADTTKRVLMLHAGVIAALFLAQFVLPEYHHGVLARVMVLAAYATGYTLLFGYTGLLSLGHAMFFAAGLYGAGLTVYHLGWSPPAGFGAGIAAGLVLSVMVGFVALRTTGVAFMIVTMMLAQAVYLASLYFGEWTRGDEGIVLTQAMRTFEIAGATIDLSLPDERFNAALILYACSLLICLAVVRAPLGRVMVAIRENEDRTRMLGYDTFQAKLMALALSGTLSAAAGASYALLFGYAGSTFASIHYSIYPLLWVLLGGAATTLGPLIGTLAITYMIDVTSGFTSAYLLLVGVMLVLLVLWSPNGLLGALRDRKLAWLP